MAEAAPLWIVGSRPPSSKDYRRHLELATLQDKVRSEVPHRKVVTISTDPVFESIEYRLQVGGRWSLLSDPERKVQEGLQIQQYTDPKHDPMISHTLVLEAGLVIYKGYPGYFFWGRPSREGLWRDLREVIRKRPVFEPTAPGLPENWEEGDKRLHYSYEKQES